MTLTSGRTSAVAYSFFLALSLVATWISQSILDGSVVLLGLLWLYQTRHQTAKLRFAIDTPVRNVYILTALYFLTAVLGYALNGREGADILFNLSRFMWVFQFMLLIYALPLIKTDIVWPWFICYTLNIVPALYGFNIFFNPDRLDYLTKQYTNERIVGLVNSATYHAHTGAVFFILGLWLILTYLQNSQVRASRAWKILTVLAIFITPLILMSILYTKTRGALLAIAISLILLIMLQMRRFVYAGLIAAGLLLGVCAALLVSQNTLQRQQSDNCRMILLKVHLEMIQQKPLLGIGYRDNMRNLSDYWPAKYDDPNCLAFKLEGSQAHNQFVNAAATTGLLGLLFFVAIWGYILWINWNWWKQKKNALATLCLTLQVYFICSCMTEITFEFAKIRYLILVIWAIVLNHKHFSSESQLLDHLKAPEPRSQY